jgi:hypothetical protein
MSRSVACWPQAEDEPLLDPLDDRRGRQVYVACLVFQVQRVQIVLLAAEGLTRSPRAWTPGATVSLWHKRFFSERLAGLEERPRPGRPRTFSP